MMTNDGGQFRKLSPYQMTLETPSKDLAQKWNTLASANRLLTAAVKNQDFGIIPSRKSLALQAYRAFWNSPGADEYAKAATKAAR